MSSPLPDALPYGVRDCKLTAYTDAGGSILGNTSVDLPNMQTFSFSETEEFEELRGDDRLIATHGAGAQVEWELEAGGLSLRAWAILTGGEIIEQGTTPNRTVTLRKKGTDSRGYFRVDGQVISDSGGDVVARVYRCRCNDSIEGEFSDGEFFITSASGVGMPLLDDANDLLYDLIQHETKASLTLTPEPNPTPTPTNLVVGSTTSNSVDLSWDAVASATGYIVEQATSASGPWTAVSAGKGGTPSTNNTTVSGLTTATDYWFRVKAVTPSGTSDPSNPTGKVTTQ